MPAILVMISVTGKVIQNHVRPKRENTYPKGTNSTTVRITVKAVLFKLYRKNQRSDHGQEADADEAETDAPNLDYKRV